MRCRSRKGPGNRRWACNQVLFSLERDSRRMGEAEKIRPRKRNPTPYLRLREPSLPQAPPARRIRLEPRPTHCRCRKPARQRGKRRRLGDIGIRMRGDLTRLRRFIRKPTLRLRRPRQPSFLMSRRRAGFPIAARRRSLRLRLRRTWFRRL